MAKRGMRRRSSRKEEMNCLVSTAVGTRVFCRDGVSVESGHAILKSRSNHIIAAAKNESDDEIEFLTRQTLRRVVMMGRHVVILQYMWPPEPGEPGVGAAPPPAEASRHNHTTPHLSPLLIGVICALTSAFLVVSYYTVIVKYCSRWHASVTARRGGAGAADPDLPDAAMEASRAAAMAITVWPVFNRGLDKAVVDSIPVFVFGKKKPPAPVPAACRDCAVCLSDFVEGESVRQLPRCAHVFHVRCIDVWFSSQDSCPICRSHVVPPPPPQENSQPRQQQLHSSSVSGSDSSGSEWRDEEASFERSGNPRGSDLRSFGERGGVSAVVGRSVSFDVSRSRNILAEIRAAAASVNGRRSSASGPVEFKPENGNSGLFKNYSVDVAAASAGSSSGGGPEAAAKGRSSAGSSLDWIWAASLRRSPSSGSRSFLWSRSSSSVLPL